MAEVLKQCHDLDEWDDLESHMCFMEAAIKEYFNQFKSRVRQHVAELEAKLEELGFEKEEVSYENQVLAIEKRQELGTLESVQKLARKIKFVLKLIENKFKQVEVGDDYQHISITNFAKLQLEEVESLMESQTIDQKPQLEELESMERATGDHQLQQTVDLMEISSANINDQLRDQKQLEEQRHQMLRARSKKHYYEKRLKDTKIIEKQLEEEKNKYEGRFKELVLKDKKLDELANNLHSNVKTTAATGGRTPSTSSTLIPTVQSFPLVLEAQPRSQQQTPSLSTVGGFPYAHSSQPLQFYQSPMVLGGMFKNPQPWQQYYFSSFVQQQPGSGSTQVMNPPFGVAQSRPQQQHVVQPRADPATHPRPQPSVSKAQPLVQMQLELLHDAANSSRIANQVPPVFNNNVQRDSNFGI